MQKRKKMSQAKIVSRASLDMAVPPPCPAPCLSFPFLADILLFRWCSIRILSKKFILDNVICEPQRLKPEVRGSNLSPLLSPQSPVPKGEAKMSQPL